MSKALSYTRARSCGGSPADESASAERQREQIRQYAEQHGYTLIGEATDLGVGSAGSPFKQKGLGPWLNDPEKVGQWDTLVVTSFDRVSRNNSSSRELAEWLRSNSKTLDTVGGLRFPSEDGGRSLLASCPRTVL
jgi:DNA invertase Pin-like site-specific DNA recombinase